MDSCLALGSSADHRPGPLGRRLLGGAQKGETAGDPQVEADASRVPRKDHWLGG